MKLRRSMLFVPGNNPGLMKDAHIYKPDSIMFDLEDAIAITEKDAARIMVYNFIKKFKDLYKKLNIETVVRMNSLDTEFGVEDLEFMVRSGVEVIRIPKTESPKDVHDVEKVVERIEKDAHIPVGTTKLMVAIESPLGALNALEIARSSKRLVAMAIGGEDYVTNLQTTRSADGIEMFTGRSLVVMSAKSAGLAALDSVYSDISNDEGFIHEAERAKQMGFDGKSLIHPRQIALIDKIYTPDEKNILKSLKIVNAAREAEKEGRGVITVNGKMVDKPIIERAKRVLALAKASGVRIGGEIVE